MKRNWVFPAACAVILALAALLTALSERDEGTYISIHSIERTSGNSFPALSEISGGVRLYVNGERAPYDHASNTYFIPQESDTEEITGDISIEAEEGYTYFLFSREGVLKTDAIKNSIGYNVYGIRGGECVSSKIIFTALPIIRIHAEGEIASDEEYVSGRISVFEAKDGGVFVKTHSMGIRVRGNTSQRFPKKSYRIRLTDQAGEKFHAPFLSLRSDDDWILNPMYADDTKIREMLAYELWDKMNSSGMNANSSDMEHSEVFLEDNYHGLYALQERVDYKQVDGDKKADILYKIAANDMPTAEELIKCASREVCRAFEMQSDVFRGSAEDIWSPAADYMAVISGGEPSLGAETSYENAADFGLWAMLTQAHDCHFKNQYLNCVRNGSGYTMYKLPWDVNNTFGDVWKTDSAETNFSARKIGSLVKDDLFSVLLEDEAFALHVKDRWRLLREGEITEEKICQRADEIFLSIAPALERDSKRWPNCGTGSGNSKDISYIHKYISVTLSRMDEYVEAL